MAISLTDEQSYAVDSLHINCIVPAGAGSGKTRVLVERYLKIIEQYTLSTPNIIESIVAITFTEKAAKEMKERVRLGMVERRELALKTGESEKALMWRSHLQNLERASISTIHSFCANILREFPLDSNVDPEFKVIDAVDADWLLSEIIEKELKKYLELEQGKLSSFFYQWTSLTGFDRTILEIKKIYHQITNSGMDIEEITVLTEQSFVASPLSLIQGREDLIALGDALFHAEGNGKKLEVFQASWPQIKEQLNYFFENRQPAEASFSSIDRMIDLTTGNFGNEVKELRKSTNEHAKRIKQWLSAIKYHDIEKEYINSFYLLLINIDASYLKEKEKINGIDFDELQAKVIKLLVESGEARAQLQKRILYLMIDEFQDNNQVQKRLVSHLLKDENGDIRPGSLFVVGDPKQSIYRFRGADVQVFKEMEKEISLSAGRVAPLKYNFRSNPKIIEFINHFFPYIMSDNTNSPNYYENAIAKRKVDLDDAIEFIPISGEKNDEKSHRELEAENIARRIQLLLADGVYAKEITILFRSMTNINIYEEALRNLQIPYYVIGGRGFYHKQEIYDIVNILEYLIDPYNSIALTGILRSPMVAITDETLYQLMKDRIWQLSCDEWSSLLVNINNEEKKKLYHFSDWIKGLREKIGRIRIDELIEEILELTHYEAILLALPHGPQAAANVGKLVRLAKDFPGDNPFSAYQFVQRIRRLMEDEQQEKEAAIESEAGDTVKLMSIHQSKGLEFPYVFIPDISKKPVHDNILIRLSGELGLSCQIPISNDEWVTPIRWLAVTEKEKKLEREESVRVFYVAATRAEKQLILSGKVEDTKEDYELNDILKLDTWSKWFDLVLNYKKISMEEKRWLFTTKDGKTSNIKITIFDEIEATTETNSKLSFFTGFEEGVNSSNIIDYTKPIRTSFKENIFTISAIKRYLFCPKYYYFADSLNLLNSLEWLKGIDINTYDDERVEENEYEFLVNNSRIPANLQGTLVHELLEQITIYPEKIDIWREQLKNFFLNRGYKINSGNELEWIKFEEDVSLYINNFKQSQFFSEASQKTIKTEYDFLFELENAKIRGTIDRLEINQDGSYSIIDYKTDVKIDKESYLPQILTYALAIMRNLNLEPKDGIIYFIRYNHLEQFSITTEKLILWEKELEEIINNINSFNTIADFNSNYNNCSICQFKSICN